MKVAEVRYTGRGIRHSSRGPSDKRYSWVRRTSGVSDSVVEIHNVEDALYFDRKEAYDVEFTPLGHLAVKVEGPVNEAEAALAALGYREKQRIAKSLGINAGGTESELEERLEPEIERLKEQMEAR